MKTLIFSLHKIKYIWYLQKKSKFSFNFILNGELQKAQPKFFAGRFSFNFTFSACSMGIILGVHKVCTYKMA